MMERGFLTRWLWIALCVLTVGLVLEGGLEIVQLGARCGNC